MPWALYPPGELAAASLPSPLFLVEPIIPTGGIVMLHGPKTAGKTQLALTLGCAVAHGQALLGEWAVRSGTVVFLEVDMPLALLQARIQQAPETQALWFLHSEPFDIVTLSRELPDELAEVANLHPDLLIVDSLRKTHSLDENDSATPSAVYSAWRRLFPDTCLAFMHHDRKKPVSPDHAAHPEEAARGTGAWLDDADTGLHLDRIRGSKGGGHVATLSFSKCRTTEEPDPMVVRMRDDSLLLEPTKPTAASELTRWLMANPNATRDECRQHLETAGYSRASAFRAVTKAGK